MKCDRCGDDTSVKKVEVDGFTGRLCDSCVEMWDEVQSE